MSEFYGWLQGNRGEITRGGSIKSGIWAKIQSWYNQCSISLKRNEEENEDILHISFGDKQSGVKLKVYINGELFSKAN